MLVLTRKVGEEIFLEHDGVRIVVKLLKIHGRAAKLGIAAPREVSIHRFGSEDSRPAQPAPAVAAEPPPRSGGLRRTFHRLFNTRPAAGPHR